ncbi:MAG: TetR/AcrR family transcriptional regulator [Deltaproteobacteria bacterium]|nr:TetR/AcrR family transcriptional regulator [Deltaproteobacteria bacterium]
MRGRKKSPDIRAAILRCATEVFAQREFHEVLTDDIAAKLGIGKGTIYRYFDSKEALYFATIVEGLKGMRAAVDEALRQPAPLAVIIQRLVETILRYFWNRRDFFILLHRHEPKLDPRERAEWQQQREEVVEQVRGVLERALPRPTLGRQHPRQAVEILFGMIRSAALFRAPGDRPAALANVIAAAFLHGVTVNAAEVGRVTRGEGVAGARLARPTVARRQLQHRRGGKSIS